MKICKSCGKKFGFFEKVYASEEGDSFCESCVKEGHSPKSEETHDYVTLDDANASAVNNSGYAQVNIPAGQKKSEWEFRVIKLSLETNEQRRSVTIEKIENVINKMGADGWELVSVLPLNVLLVKKDGIEQPAMIFKRKKDSLRVEY